MRDANRDRAFESVLSAHGAALARLVASYESRPALREELLQDIAFALWRALPSFRQEASEKTFVMRIATNRALSHLAARHADGKKGTEPDFADDRWNSGSVPFLVENVEDSGPRPEELAARMQGAERLQRAVRNLSLAHRQVLVLALEGLSHEDIGRVLGLTAGHVAVRLHRGKTLLKSALGETP